ncbi:hypothetical protein [Thiomonas sp. 13-64-67]|uniref:hypothetical protein n=1 Tax=Thiomonas sp. 13-64-67 TaxID=1970447 RepID=UPI002580E2CF|nr:hypothetical protein [Thiomonas sp. 13-64-67]
MRHVHIAILGAGTAGLTALSQVRKHTDDFVIINHGPYGTTCARVGFCPPCCSGCATTAMRAWPG